MTKCVIYARVPVNEEGGGTVHVVMQVLVYYVALCPPELPFPPPQQSALRMAVNQLRADRRLTPQLRMLRGGVDDVKPFHDCLIEEPDAGLAAAGAAAGQGFVLFLESVRAEVARVLQSAEQGS